MVKVLWLLALALPLWAALAFGAPKWVSLLLMVPFFLHSMGLENAEENALGDASGGFRTVALVMVGAGGLIMAGVLYLLWTVFFPNG